MFLYFKVNEHLKDIMEQEQKLKEHHTVEAPGGQKVYISKKKSAFMNRLCRFIYMYCLGNTYIN